MTAMLALAVGLGAVATWWFLVRPAPASLHFHVSVAEFGLTLTNGGVAISPDGLTVVFTARGAEGQPRLYVRRLDSEQKPRPLEGTEDAVAPQFSPDGSWVAFAARGLLKKLPLREGPPQTLARIGPQGVSRGGWTADGFIMVSQWPGVPVRVSAEGGVPAPVAPLAPGTYMWPHLLPDGKKVILTVTRIRQPQVVVASPDGQRSPVLQTAAMCARYLPTGHLVYEAEGRLRAVAFDPERLRLLGESRVVIDDIAVGEADGGTASYDYDVSPAGTIVYRPASALRSRLVWRDRAGRIEPLPLDARPYWCPSLSPDGRQVAVTVGQESGADVWTGSVHAEPLTPLTFDGTSPNSLFSPDGRWVYFNSQTGDGKYDLFRRPSDRSLQAQRLSDAPGNKKPTAMSRDGSLLFNLASGPADRHIMKMNVERAGPAEPFGAPSGEEIEAAFSPDGKWVAYQSNESGSWQVYVTPYPGPGPRERVSIDGGMGPVWNPRGDGELFYQTRTALMSVRIVRGAAGGAPIALFSCRKSEDYRREFDVAPTGDRFLFMEPTTPRTEINVITNWFEELKTKVPLAR
jgi:serine/threonine-protein kinase